jgi:hypothetical protein
MVNALASSSPIDHAQAIHLSRSPQLQPPPPVCHAFVPLPPRLTPFQ